MDAEKWERTALRMADYMRLVPAVALLAYGISCAWIARWFMGLDDPKMEQSMFISVVFGIAPLIINFLTPVLAAWDERARQIRERAKA